MSMELSTDEKLALGGGSVAIVGALLPWAAGNGLMDGAGIELLREILVLFLGLALFGLIYVADWTESAQLIVAAFGVVITGIAGYTLAEAFGVIGDADFSAGVGLYVAVLGGLLVLAAGARAYTSTEPTAGMYSHR